MPYFSRRSRFSSRRVNRRRPMRRRPTSSRRMMTPNRVRRIIGAELKRHVTGVPGIAPAVVGSIVGLTDMRGSPPVH